MSVAFSASLSDSSLVHLSSRSWKSDLGEYHYLGAFIVSPMFLQRVACRYRLLHKWDFCCPKFFFSVILPLFFLNKVFGIDQPG